MDVAVQRQTEQARHSTWAGQQRDTFRRQRLEQAARYTRSGIRPRSAYADLGALAAAEQAHEAMVAGHATTAIGPDGEGASGDGESPSADPMQRYYSSPALQGTLNGNTVRGVPYSMPYGPGGMGLRQRPATAAPSGTFSYGQPGAAGAGMTGRSLSATASGHGNEFAATVQHTAGLAATLPRTNRTGSPATIPLPKKTYVKVYDRMAVEAAETPAAKAAAVAAAKAAAEAEQAAAKLAGELEALDTFEAQMRSLQRARSKAARLEGRRLPNAIDDDDDD